MSASLGTLRSASIPWRSSPRWLLLLIGAALLGLLHVLLTLGPHVLSGADPIWQHVQGDRAQAVLGAEAFLRDPHWHFPLGLTDRLLSGGRPVSIVYADSAPWLAIGAKLLGLGPDRFSVIGLVAFLSVALQPVACALLMLAAGIRRSETVLAGAALGAMMPSWYMRLVWHPALASHWIVVLALALACQAIRRGPVWPVMGSLAGLGAFAIGIHAYLFVMVAAIAAGACFAAAARAPGWRSILGGLGWLALFLACSGTSAWVLGYGEGGSAGGFGVFSMNLLSPFVPQHSGLLAALTGDPGAFLDATGGQYEGFNYLGGGILLIVAVATIAWLAGRRPRLPRAALPLGLALAALVLFALSDRVWLGRESLAEFDVPRSIADVVGELRSSGRMAWPATYAALALGLCVVDRLPRRLGGGLLAASLLLQTFDTSLVRHALSQEYVPAATLVAPGAALWRTGPLAGTNLRLVPSLACASPRDHETMRQLGLLAERAGGTVEGGPLARTADGVCTADRFDAALAPTRAGVEQLLFANSLPGSALVLATASGECAAMPEGLLCGAAAAAAARAGLLPAPAPVSLPRLEPGRALTFSAGGDGTALLAAGWLAPESFGAWTDSQRALLILPLPDGWTGDATIRLHAIAHGSTPLHTQPVTVLADGHAIAQFLVSMERWADYTIRIPASAITHHLAVLELITPYPMLYSRTGVLKHRSHALGLQSASLVD